MAIIQKKENVNGNVLWHTYSDSKKKIRCGDYVYDEAYDVHAYTYAETDEDVSEDTATRIDKTELAKLKLEIEKLKAEQTTQNEAIEASADGLTDLISQVMGGDS